MSPEHQGQRVVIRKYHEITVDGKTHLLELYAEGFLDAAEAFHPTACVGYTRLKTPMNIGVAHTKSAA